MKIQNLSIIISILCCVILSCQAQNYNRKSKVEKIKTYLAQLEEKGFSGTILVDIGGEKVWSEGYGLSNQAEQINNAPNTVFDIGSITKQFTAASILKLEMQDKLSVEDPLSKFFPFVPKDKKDITIHQLLTHSSGLPGAIGDDYEAVSTEEFLKAVFQKKLNFEDATKYRYSNVGYSLLAIIIEEVSGQTYEQYLYENLWKIAGMDQTGYSRPNFKKETVAVGYRGKKTWGKPNEKKWNSDAPYWNLKGNGGVLSTVEDMYRWHQALLENEMLSSEAKEKFYQPYVEEGEGSGSYYAYGWAIFDTPRNTKLIAHNGGNGIFFADFWRYLEEEITILVMTNRSKRYSELIASQIAGLILKTDFEAELPSDQKSEEFEEAAEDLARSFVKAIKNEDAKEWENFIRNHTTEEFINFVPMKKHLGFFRDFHNTIKDSNIEEADITEEEVLLIFKSEKGQNTVSLGIVNTPSGDLKVGGIQME